MLKLQVGEVDAAASVSFKEGVELYSSVISLPFKSSVGLASKCA